jgi:alkanesulfonate monooxygenase SsuD/methylene tetrahydromethanopterin reductase-like flavin-dependent oxidoreductase (luciferase family)
MPETVARGLAAFAEQTGVDEIMVTSNIHDHAARLRSFAITAEAGAALARRKASHEVG